MQNRGREGAERSVGRSPGADQGREEVRLGQEEERLIEVWEDQLGYYHGLFNRDKDVRPLLKQCARLTKGSLSSCLGFLGGVISVGVTYYNERR